MISERTATAPMKILAIADIHGKTAMIERAGELIRHCDLLLIAGDITRSGTVSEAAEVIAAVEKFNSSILAVHGNWDSPEVGDFLAEKGYGLHGTGRTIGGIGFFGLGGSSPTPMHTRCEYTEDRIAVILDGAYRAVESARTRVLLSHAPPRGVRDRTFLFLRGGSTALRAFLESHEVDLCVCGHIHEAGGIETLGEAIVANPGSFKSGKYISAELNDTMTLSRGRLRQGLSRTA